jgi:SAM-dependent methyltransferase
MPDIARNYRHVGRKKHSVAPHYWKARYRRKDTYWDHGEASPGLVDFLAQDKHEAGRVLVPGCGRGHDARALAKAGFDVVGIDVSEIAVRDATALATKDKLTSICFKRADYFGLPAALAGPYDWMFEHTFFCAIDPKLRDRYVEIAASILRQGGWLLGVFYNIQPESGPPFGCTREELCERFSPKFTLRLERVPRSYQHRQGKELLMLWQRM